MTPNEIYAVVMVILLLAGVVIGFPVAFMLAGLGVIFGTIAYGGAIASYQAALNRTS